ncbi:hypothetical protein DSO57_1033175 [Entomophthora muscae]|uniref:Uncharacterized protein n=1 Tax=Entomophthora muscae TaxID=34485 RepID=A0ACC2UK32_9FUNG|nr:hypothetical protein DSO57_1033175 [Entomophthora muscae]
MSSKSLFSAKKLNPDSKKSTAGNNNLNCWGSTPSDVGSKNEAGNVLCLVSGPLMASPSVVPGNLPPGPPVSVGK